MIVNKWIFIAILALCFTFQALAQDELDLLEDDVEMDFSMDEESEFSEEPHSGVDEDTVASPSAIRISLDHALSFRLGEQKNMVNNRTGVNIDYASSIGESLYAKIDATGSLYWTKDHRAISKAQDYDFDSLIKEAWLQKSFEQLTFKLGLQSIVWGDVEGAQATDTLNPIDTSEFLFVDFEDTRIGQETISATLYTESLTWETFVTPVPQFNKNPADGSIYARQNSLSSLKIISVEKPNPEYGLRTKFKLGVSEMALLVANLTPNQPGYQLKNNRLQEVAKPFLLYGTNFNYPIGQTLLKADLGYKTDQGINDKNFELVYKDRLDTAFGIETTISQHSLVASVSLSQIIDWDESLTQKKDSGYVNLGWTKTYFNEDLTLNLGLLGVLSRSDRIANGLVDYKLNDRFKFSMGLFVFSITDEESDFYAFREEHRIEFKTKYQF
ncbi:MAG: hypothetical protein HN646_07795 [Nitrospina sp.]|jgi:hypothetical protein|nr:hypothetical protein [Deltaproteobacteria bacterium]MBT6661786.1 hypothetical protein [Nitrospina sp.]MBT7522161.1 hypothetical protein [Nitrospina sp.]